MSVVTNVLFVCSDGEGRLIGVINKWTEEQNLGSLSEVSDRAGGKKSMECRVWAAAFNYLNREEFIARVRESLKVKHPCTCRPQLFLREQSDCSFREVDLSEPQ